MKSIFRKISISIIMLTIVFFAGCMKISPSQAEVREKTKKLESIPVNKGTIADITFVNGHDFTQIKFSDGGIVLCGYHWKNKKDVKIGQTGTLFVSSNHNKRHCHCHTCWWSWKEDVSSKEVKITNTENKKQETNIVETDWYRSDQIKNLETDDLVLIQMNDKKVTIGFITYDKQWKLGINKGKYRHGATLTNVARWKRINLE